MDPDNQKTDAALREALRYVPFHEMSYGERYIPRVEAERAAADAAAAAE